MMGTETVQNERGKEYWNPAEDVAGEHECEHTPDKLRMIDEVYHGDTIEHVFQCKCGKTVTEIFILCDQRIT